MTRLSGTLGRVLIVGVLSGGIGACAADASDPAVEEELAQQIQGELDAAVAANPAAFASVRPLRPVLKCVEHLDSTHLRAHFGYTNGSASAIPVRVGFMNRFWPPPIDRGQPTTFSAGSQADVVQVPFGLRAASIWVLGNHFAIATRFSKTCPAGGSGGATGSGTGGSGTGGFGVGGFGQGGAGVGGGNGGGGVGGGAVGGAPGCVTRCDDHNPCTIDICNASTTFQCVNTPAINGTGCDDGNPCTVADTCQAGQCVAGAPKFCGVPDDCHLSGVCDVATGACSNPVRADNSSCTLRDGCNFSGQCHAGVCLRGAEVTCNAACDQCTFFPGAPDVCSATADGCSNCTPDTDGCQFIVDPTDRALCENLYACLIAPTHPGTSVPGSCLVAGDPVACWCGTNPGTCTIANAPPTQANGPCLAQILAAAKTTDASVVNERLVNPTFPIGRAFNVANCQVTYCASECHLPLAVAPCPALDLCHLPGLRDPITGVCSNPPARDGTSCNDGNDCTKGDACQAGACVGGPVCPAPDQCHTSSCDHGLLRCVDVAKPDGTACSLATPCATAGSCSAGVCLGVADSLCSCGQCGFGPAPGQVDLCSATADGCANCNPETDGCDAIADPADRFACQDLFACLVAPTHPGSVLPGSCIQGGNPLPCWCGTHQTTCVTSNDPASQANGPCLTRIFTAAKSTDAATINQRFVNPIYPLGRAMNLAICLGTFCAAECSIPF